MFFFIAGLIMFVPVYLYGNTHVTSILTLFIQVMLGVIIYLIIGGGFLCFKEKELLYKFIRRDK